MTTADNMTPVLCTLAKHHLGDHDARGVPGRSACRKVIRYDDPPLDPADVPPESGPAGSREEHVRRVAERATEDAMKMTVPTEPPPLAELIEAVEAGDEWADVAKTERDRAESEYAKALASQARRRSALAMRAGKGALVMVGSVLFRSVPPRKPKGGEVAADALWRLEPVEVAK